MRVWIAFTVLIAPFLHCSAFVSAECPPGTNPFAESACGYKQVYSKCEVPEYSCSDWTGSECDGEVSRVRYDVRQCSDGNGANGCHTCWFIGSCYSSQKCYTDSICEWDPVEQSCTTTGGVDNYVGDASPGSNRQSTGAPCCDIAEITRPWSLNIACVPER